MPLSVLRRAYTPEKLAVTYRLLDELLLEENESSESFTKDPPNATVSAFNKCGYYPYPPCY
jgi:hypothetical protein